MPRCSVSFCNHARAWPVVLEHNQAQCPDQHFYKAHTGFAIAPNADGAFFCSFFGAGGSARGTVACAQRS